HEIGLNKGYNKAKEFGLKLTDSDKYYGLALGGLEYGASPLTMAGAYQTFANGGTLYRPHLITKIVDASGAVIVDNTKPKGEKIISKETANEMTSMLLGTFSNGTAVSANPAGYTMAGKTGTTEASYDENKNNDQWIVGYTPDTVISTWLGFEKSDKEHNFIGTSGEVVGAVFKAEAEQMLPYSQNTQFPVADAYATGGKVVAASDVTQIAKQIKIGKKESIVLKMMLNRAWVNLVRKSNKVVESCLISLKIICHKRIRITEHAMLQYNKQRKSEEGKIWQIFMIQPINWKANSAS